jgi:ssDNA thymidine ADP-ribosyltransferase DarT-like protein
MSIARIPRLFHFCDRRNLDSIRQHGGIYSLAHCENLGIAIPIAGGDDASQQTDRSKGFDKYVHLSFTTGHPMAYRAVESGRIQTVVYIHVNRNVLEQPGVLFVPGLANTIGIQTYTIDQAIKNELIDFEVLYSWTNWKDAEIQNRRQRAEKYEILVPASVPLDRILYLPNG